MTIDLKKLTAEDLTLADGRHRQGSEPDEYVKVEYLAMVGSYALYKVIGVVTSETQDFREMYDTEPYTEPYFWVSIVRVKDRGDGLPISWADYEFDVTRYASLEAATTAYEGQK